MILFAQGNKKSVITLCLPVFISLLKKNRPISPKLKKTDISKADTSCKVRSSHRRREGRPQSGSAPRKDRQDGAGIGPAGGPGHEVGRRSSPGPGLCSPNCPASAAFGRGHGKVGIAAVKEDEGKNQAQL